MRFNAPGLPSNRARLRHDEEVNQILGARAKTLAKTSFSQERVTACFREALHDEADITKLRHALAG